MQRMTEQRRVILETLRDLKTHPTADALYAAVRRRLPRISLGTVYRNLDELARCGLIRKLDTVGASARFDGDTDAHWHVRCLGCGRLDDVHVRPASVFTDAVSGATGYEVRGYRLEFEGLCPECRIKKVKNGAHGGKRRKSAGVAP